MNFNLLTFWFSVFFGKGTVGVAILCGVFLAIPNLARGQDTSEALKNQFGFRHDNDFIVLTDRYYSTGLFITYRHSLDTGLFKNGKEQLNFQIQQQAFTPKDIETTNILGMDRPYVGFLGLNGGWSYYKEHSGVNMRLMVGIAGRASGGGGFQRWYHRAIVISDPPVWVAEMEDSFHTNMYASYTHEWQLFPNPFSVHFVVRPEVAFGSKDTYFHPEVVAIFGRRSSADKSIAFDQIGSAAREIFFSISAAYRIVGHNGLLEGNAFGDNSILLVEAEKSVLHLGVDFKHRSGKNDYWIGYRFSSQEATTTKTHQYIILSYARNF